MLKPTKTKTVHVKYEDNIQLHDMVRKASLAFLQTRKDETKIQHKQKF